MQGGELQPLRKVCRGAVPYLQKQRDHAGSMPEAGLPAPVVTVAVQAAVASSSCVTVSVPAAMLHLLRRNRSALIGDLAFVTATADISRLSNASAFSVAVGSAPTAASTASSAVPRAVASSAFVGRLSTLVCDALPSKIKSRRPPSAQSVCSSFVSARIAAISVSRYPATVARFAAVASPL